LVGSTYYLKLRVRYILCNKVVKICLELKKVGRHEVMLMKGEEGDTQEGDTHERV